MLNQVTIESLNRFTILVIGPAGIGKTSLLRTIPADEKVVMLSAEGGLLSVRDIISKKTISAYEITSFEDMREAFTIAQASDAQWVFIDSLTEIASRCVESMKKKYPSKSDGYAMWGDYNDLLTSLIKSYRDLNNKSVVFTCLPQIEKDELNRRYIGPAISGAQLKDRLTAYFDEVFYFDFYVANDTSYRAFYTQPIDRYPAKDRSGKLETIEEPNLAKIKEKILGGVS